MNSNEHQEREYRNIERNAGSDKVGKIAGPVKKNAHGRCHHQRNDCKGYCSDCAGYGTFGDDDAPSLKLDM